MRLGERRRRHDRIGEENILQAELMRPVEDPAGLLDRAIVLLGVKSLASGNLRCRMRNVCQPCLIPGLDPVEDRVVSLGRPAAQHTIPGLAVPKPLRFRGTVVRRVPVRIVQRFDADPQLQAAARNGGKAVMLLNLARDYEPARQVRSRTNGDDARDRDGIPRRALACLHGPGSRTGDCAYSLIDGRWGAVDPLIVMMLVAMFTVHLYFPFTWLRDKSPTVDRVIWWQVDLFVARA